MIRYLLPLLLVVIALGLFFGFTRDRIDAIYLQQDKLAEQNQALANDKDLQKIRKEKLDLYNSFSYSDLERINKLLPDGIDNVRLIIDLDNIASRYNMAVKNAKIKADSAADGVVGRDNKRYGAITLSFSVTGSYNDLRLFLRDLETSLRLVDVTGLSFTASDKDNNDYSVEVRTYWLK